MSRCPLCSEASEKVYFSERGHDVLGCDHCDLFFIHPYPGDVSDVHETVSQYAYSDLHMLAPERQYAAEIQHFPHHLPAILEACGDAESVLDVGCGTGHLLELLGRNSSLHRVGIELNVERAALAREKAGCEVFQVPIERFTYTRKFDAIILWNVLSHLPDFDSLFTSLHGLLSDRGIVILKVGEVKKDFDSRAFRDWGIPDHLHFLGLRTIDFIADKYGFSIARHDREPITADLFNPVRWRAPGRSRLRNLLKSIAVRTPGALPLLSRLYELKFGRTIFSSFVVLARA